jgi:hypothetical protein
MSTPTAPRPASRAATPRPPPPGTGGSLLVIGSAAGVAYMSMEGAGFGWYLRRVTPVAAAGYVAALAAYVLINGAPAPAPGAGA